MPPDESGDEIDLSYLSIFGCAVSSLGDGMRLVTVAWFAIALAPHATAGSCGEVSGACGDLFGGRHPYPRIQDARSTRS